MSYHATASSSKDADSRSVSTSPSTSMAKTEKTESAVVATTCVLNIQLDFNVSVSECFDTSTSNVLRELDESNRSVQKSAKTTSI